MKPYIETRLEEFRKRFGDVCLCGQPVSCVTQDEICSTEKEIVSFLRKTIEDVVGMMKLEKYPDDTWPSIEGENYQGGYNSAVEVQLDKAKEILG